MSAPERVPAGPVVEHAVMLREAGVYPRLLARAADVPERWVFNLLHGRDVTVLSDRAARVLSVTTDDFPAAKLRVGPTQQIALRKHVQGLLNEGGSTQWIADKVSITRHSVGSMLRGTTQVSVDVAARVFRLTVPDELRARPARAQGVPGVERGVPAGPVREHLEHVMLRGGVDATWIAAQAQVSIKTVRRVLRGAGVSVYGPTAMSLMSVRAPAVRLVRAPQFDPETLIEYLQDVKARGFSVAYLSRKTGLAPRMLAPSYLRRGVSRDVHDRIVSLWHGTQGRSGTPLLRTWPALARALAYAPSDVVAQEVGVTRATVHRVQRGEAVHSDIADALMAWVSRGTVPSLVHSAA